MVSKKEPSVNETDYSAVKPKPQKVERRKEIEETPVLDVAKVNKPPAVTTGKAIIRKRSLGERLIDSTIGKGTMASIRDYIVHEVIVPNVKDIIYNSIMGSLGMAIYRDGYSHVNRRNTSSWNTGSNSRPVRTTRTNYADRGPRGSVRSTRNYGPTEVLVDVKEYAVPDIYTARDVIRRLQREIDIHSYVSIGSYYDAIEAESNFTDDTYGWRDLTGVSYRNVKEGVVIDFPPAELL